jgi:hypothetical protein
VKLLMLRRLNVNTLNWMIRSVLVCPLYCIVVVYKIVCLRDIAAAMELPPTAL